MKIILLDENVIFFKDENSYFCLPLNEICSKFYFLGIHTLSNPNSHTNKPITCLGPYDFDFNDIRVDEEKIIVLMKALKYQEFAIKFNKTVVSYIFDVVVDTPVEKLIYSWNIPIDYFQA